MSEALTGVAEGEDETMHLYDLLRDLLKTDVTLSPRR